MWARVFVFVVLVFSMVVLTLLLRANDGPVLREVKYLSCADQSEQRAVCCALRSRWVAVEDCGERVIR